jgi:hypothetical protein
MWRCLFTGSDNATPDLGRVLWAKLCAAYVVITLWSVARGAAFDPWIWASGAAVLLTGGGVALKVKETTEPKP